MHTASALTRIGTQFWSGAENHCALPGCTVANVLLPGSLNSAASTIYRLEFFASPSCDPSGYGEGQAYLGFTEVTTDASGNADFSTLLAGGVAAGQFAAVTASDPNGNTSEFSACATVTAAQLQSSWHYEYDPLYRLSYACAEWDAAVYWHRVGMKKCM